MLDARADQPDQRPPARGGLDLRLGESGGLQTNPIVADDVLFTTTPKHRVVALDAGTGAARWTFDSGIEGRGPNRGVTYWTNGDDRRIFTGQGQFVYALDAGTGRPIAGFGATAGSICAKVSAAIRRRSPCALTTPGVDLQGSADRRRPRQRRAAGIAGRRSRLRRAQRRAALELSHDSASRRDRIRHLAEPTRGRYTGGVNNWAGMAVDDARGVVYVPTGSASADFYGANRLGDDLFANSLIALDARDRTPASGISRRFVTTSGIAIFRRRPAWSPSRRTAVASTPSRRRRSTGSCSCSIDPPARRCFRSSRRDTRRAPSTASARPPRSRCRPGRSRSRGSGSPSRC